MRTLFLTLITCLFVLPAHAKYNGGTGEPNDPYQVATAADLIALGETPNDYDKHFILTGDIDLDPNLPGRKVFDKAVIAADNDPTNQDFQGVAFIGVFDGNGHRISHLTIEGRDFVGLFGRFGWGRGEVKDLGVVDVMVSGDGSVGGLAGVNFGTVVRCYSTGTVSGSDYGVGGLLGWTQGDVTNCYSTCSVTGSRYIGGLVGIIHMPSSVAYSYSTGIVGNSGQSIGGLVGSSGGLVTACFWDVQTSGQTASAGGTGLTTAKMKTAGTFLSWGACGNEGVWTIDDGNDYPRLAWEHKPGTVLHAHLSDFVSGTGSEDDPYLIHTASDLDTIAKFPCEQNKHFKLMFLAGEGTQDSPYLIYTAAELNLLGASRYELGRYFKLMADIDLSDFDGKDGRPAFNIIAAKSDTGTFGYQGVPFAGVFDGNGHKISYLTITGTSYLGLFADLALGAEIKSLGVVDVNVGGSGDYVGGLVGGNDGTVTYCYSTGLVSGNKDVGGLVGDNHQGALNQCYSTAAVGGEDSVGGLVGINGGTMSSSFGGPVWTGATIESSYATGRVAGDSRVGGLVGLNTDDVRQCHSTGQVSGSSWAGGLVGDDRVALRPAPKGVPNMVHVGVVTASFWNVETSGQATSAGGEGKTTAEMQTASTFLDAGWDFVGETANGTQDIWWIDEGKDYPRLWWER